MTRGRNLHQRSYRENIRSVAKPEPELPNYRAKSFFGVDAKGRHIYVYNDNADRQGLWYKTKTRGGTWSSTKRFDHDNNRNSYPTVQDKPGEWIAVWDSSNKPDKKRTAIRFGRLEIGNGRATY